MCMSLTRLISQLDVWFPKQSILDAIEIFCPQYRLQLDVEFTFSRQMEILKGFHCNPWSCEQFRDKKFTPMVASIILAWDLNVQNGLFKLTMKSNVVQAMAKVVALVTNQTNLIFFNPFTLLWQVIHASQILSHSFAKCLKVAKIVVIHVMVSINDEHWFSSISFLKKKLHNHLNLHLQLLVATYG